MSTAVVPQAGGPAKVVVAMSGGVDSSLAAALLVEQGYKVIGLMLRLWAEDGALANRCCAPDALCEARRVADRLGIPFYVRDYRDLFKHYVVDPFLFAYASGLTPNPCVLCNEQVRFGHLLNEVRALGAQFLATGHYARLRRSDSGQIELLKGCDPDKDQSYVLYRLTQTQLAHVLFPLGGYHKREVRALAQARGLPVYDRPESQDLCFLGNGDYRQFIARHLPEALRPGPVEDSSGRVLGQHAGLANYTVGQRRGLGLSARQPRYVLKLDPARNALIVGTADELGRCELTAGQMTYVSGQPPTEPLQVSAKIRYRAAEVPALLMPLPYARAHLRFEQPLRDITPGQSVVLYRGEVVLGGGVIELDDRQVRG